MRMSGTASIVDSLDRNFVSQFYFDKSFLIGAGIGAGFGFSNGTV